MDCNKTTVKELRKLAKKHGIKGYYKFRKKDLCKKLIPFLEDVEDVDFFSKKCKPRKLPGRNVWTKKELWNICQKHNIAGCASRLSKSKMCDVISIFFKKGAVEEDTTFESKSCKGIKSKTNWGKDELQRFCDSAGLEYKSRDTKKVLCAQLTKHFAEESKKSSKKKKKTSLPPLSPEKVLSIGEVEVPKGSKLSQEVDHVMVYLSGLLWLINKHRKDLCIPVRLSSLRSPRFGASFCDFCICWFAKTKKLMWGFTETEESFWETLDSWCVGTKKFAAMPLYMISTDEKERHMNFLLFNLHDKTMERFEPNGHIISKNKLGEKLRERQLEKRLRHSARRHGYKYIPTKAFCPRLGPQVLQEAEKAFKEIGEPEGFCAFWSLWYADRRLRYPNLSSKELIEKLLIALNKKGNLKRFISSFATFIHSEKERITNEAIKYKKQDKLTIKRAVVEALLWEMFRG